MHAVTGAGLGVVVNDSEDDVVVVDDDGVIVLVVVVVVVVAIGMLDDDVVVLDSIGTVAVPVIISTLTYDPFVSENTKSNKQSTVTSPSNSMRIPLPAEITLPVNEKARTVDDDTDTVKPASEEAPPDALVTHPSE